MTIDISTLISTDIVLGYTGSKGAVSNWQRKTANYTAVDNDRIIADTSFGTFTITLPATVYAGYYIQITDGNDFAANNLLVARNSNTINNLADDVQINIPNATYEFFYNGSTWLITATSGPIGYTGSASTNPGYTGSVGYAGSIGYIGSYSYVILADPPSTNVSNSAVLIDSFSTTQHRTAKYTISVSHESEYQAAEALLVHDGYTAKLVTYGIVYTGNARLMNFSANVDNGLARLYGQGIYSNVQVKLQKIYISL